MSACLLWRKSGKGEKERARPPFFRLDRGWFAALSQAKNVLVRNIFYGQVVVRERCAQRLDQGFVPKIKTSILCGRILRSKCGLSPNLNLKLLHSITMLDHSRDNMPL